VFEVVIEGLMISVNTRVWHQQFRKIAKVSKNLMLSKYVRSLSIDLQCPKQAIETAN
jgi:hypothetical protein